MSEKPRDLMADNRAMLAMAAEAVHAVATPHELLWRRPGTFGKRYLGLSALIGTFLALPLFAQWRHAPDAGSPLVVTFWKLQLAFLVLHGIAARLSGRPRHLRLAGESWLRLLWPRLGPVGIALLEWLGSLFLGLPLVLVCPTAYQFLIAVGAVNLLHFWLIEARERRETETAFTTQAQAEMFRQRFEHYRGR